MASVGLQGGMAGWGGARFGAPGLGVRGVEGLLVHRRWLLGVVGVAGLLRAGGSAALVVAPQRGGERGMSGGSDGFVAVASHACFVGFLEERDKQNISL